MVWNGHRPWDSSLLCSVSVWSTTCHAPSVAGKIVLLGRWRSWVRKSEISRGNVRFEDLNFLFHRFFFFSMLFNLIEPVLLHWHYLHCYWTSCGDTLWAQATLRCLCWYCVGRYQPQRQKGMLQLVVEGFCLSFSFISELSVMVGFAGECPVLPSLLQGR